MLNLAAIGCTKLIHLETVAKEVVPRNQTPTVYNLLRTAPERFSRDDVLRIGDAIMDYLGHQSAKSIESSAKPTSKPKRKGKVTA